MATIDLKLERSQDAQGAARIKNLPNAASNGEATPYGQMRDYVANNGAVWVSKVLSATILNPTNVPGTPTAGDRYLIAGTGGGGWTGHNNQVVEYVSGPKTDEGSWVYYTAGPGFVVTSTSNLTGVYILNGSNWELKRYATTNKFVGTITGDGTQTSFMITHNLGTEEFVYSVKTESNKAYDKQPSVVAIDVNSAAVDFLVAPANGVVIKVPFFG